MRHKRAWLGLLLLSCCVTALVILAVSIFGECSEPKIFEDNHEGPGSFRKLSEEAEIFDPVELARRHHKMKDYRLLALDGIVPQIPGLGDRSRDRFDRRFVVGGGDEVHGQDHLEWKKKARGFAEKYNLEKIDLMSEKGAGQTN